MQPTVQSYVGIYLLLVFLTFLLVYWGFRYSLNEAEALSIALVVGFIFLSIQYESVINYYYSTENRTQMQFTIGITVFLVTITIIFLIGTIIGLLTFGKTKHLDIFEIDN